MQCSDDNFMTTHFPKRTSHSKIKAFLSEIYFIPRTIHNLYIKLIFFDLNEHFKSIDLTL